MPQAIEHSARTVIIVAGAAFPPNTSSTVHRMLGFSRHLPDCGWRVIVQTLPSDYRPRTEQDPGPLKLVPDEVRVLRSPPWFFRKVPRSSTMPDPSAVKASGRENITQWMWSRARELKRHLIVPDLRVLWVPSAFKELKRLARTEKIDAVLTTSRENSTHLVGWLASKRLGLPWVADFQDPWETRWHPPANRIQGWIDRKMALSVLARADHVIFASENIRRLFRRQYEFERDTASVVTNGFEPSVGESPHSRKVAGKRGTLKVVHTGRFYGLRSPKAFLTAVVSVNRTHPHLVKNLEVIFAGGFDSKIGREVSPFLDAPWLRVLSQVPHDESLRLQHDADLLLLISGEESFSLPGKVFEYIAASSPILAICSEHSDTAELLRELGVGFVVASGDVEHMRDLLQKFLEGHGWQPTIDPGEKVSAYHWSGIVQRVSKILDAVAQATV